MTKERFLEVVADIKRRLECNECLAVYKDREDDNGVEFFIYSYKGNKTEKRFEMEWSEDGALRIHAASATGIEELTALLSESFSDKEKDRETEQKGSPDKDPLNLALLKLVE